MLNDHFATVGANMAGKFDDIDPNRLKDPLEYMKEEVRNSFVLSPTSTYEMHTLIDKLNNKKSSSYDLISNSILKETKDIIAPYLTVHLTLSLSLSLSLFFLINVYLRDYFLIALKLPR